LPEIGRGDKGFSLNLSSSPARHELHNNHFKAREPYSSGVVEGMHLKCNLIRRRACGLRSFEALLTSRYHNLGYLPEHEITRRFC
jgi:hypothetical protein